MFLSNSKTKGGKIHVVAFISVGYHDFLERVSKIAIIILVLLKNVFEFGRWISHLGGNGV